MNYRLIFCIIGTLLLLSCSKRRPQIDVDCEKNEVGNYIIRWETMPVFDGKVDIYSSTNPHCSATKTKVAEAKGTDEIATVINDDPTKRYYFTLVFDKKYHIRTSTRMVMIPAINTLSDLGGYYSIKYRNLTKWGQLYHSSPIRLNDGNSCRALADIGVKTIINLRTQADTLDRAYKDRIQIYHIPLENELDNDALSQFAKCCDEGIDGAQRKEFFRVLCKNLLTNHLPTYRHIFDLLSNKDLYPIVLESSNGSTISGFLTTLVLFSLGINNDVIIDDFNNNQERYANSVKESANWEELQQLKKVMQGKRMFIETVQSNIQDYYGGVDDFITDALKLSSKQRQSLRDAMFCNR